MAWSHQYSSVNSKFAQDTVVIALNNNVFLAIIIRFIGFRPVCVLQGAVINGAILTITYNEPLDGYSCPDFTDITVKVNGQIKTLTSISTGGLPDGKTVILTLQEAVNSNDTVTVSYTKGTNPIQDLAGNAAANFTDMSVINNTP